jgi:hypothetical protein
METTDTVNEDIVVFNLDFDNNKLNILFGVDRTVTMELNNDNETVLCDMVLSDPNFWAQFLGTFSAALQKSL